MDEEREREAEAPRYASLEDYLRVLRERWISILLVALVIGGAAFAYSESQPDEYVAAATLNARDQAQDSALAGAASGPATNPQALVAELSAKANSEALANSVRKSLESDLSTGEIRSRVSSSIDVQTGLVRIQVTDRDPDFAAELANTYADELTEATEKDVRSQIANALKLAKQQKEDSKGQTIPGSNEDVILEERIRRLQTLKEIVRPVETITSASPPGSRTSPQPSRNTALALIAGIFLGIVVAFARDSLDKRLKTPRDVEEEFGLSRLGQLSLGALGGTILAEKNGHRQLDPVDLEAARIIRTNLEVLGVERPLRTIAVTSPLPGEGKSTVAMALAWASAVAGKSTILIECDLRQPVVAKRLALQPSPGLTDVLSGTARPAEVLQVLDVGMETRGLATPRRAKNGEVAPSPSDAKFGSLVCITAGTPHPSPAELLASEKFADVLTKIKKAYDTVILDTSPMLSVVDTRELLPLVDGVILCARSYQTTRDHASATREALARFPVYVPGIVVTGVRHQDDDYYAYYSRYAAPLATVAKPLPPAAVDDPGPADDDVTTSSERSVTTAEFETVQAQPKRGRIWRRGSRRSATEEPADQADVGDGDGESEPTNS